MRWPAHDRGARDARVDAGVEREVLHLLAEAPRFLLAAVRQGDRDARVAVHAPLHVQQGLAVPREDEDPHR